MNGAEYQELREGMNRLGDKLDSDIGGLHEKLDRRDERTQDKLDRIIETQSIIGERMSIVEAATDSQKRTCEDHRTMVVGPLRERVERNSTVVNGVATIVAAISFVGVVVAILKNIGVFG